MNYEVEAARKRARECTTPEEHLWCLALAIGPDDPEACRSRGPIDVAAHVTALGEWLAHDRNAISEVGISVGERHRVIVEVDRETGLREHRWCQACMRDHGRHVLGVESWP